MHRFKRAALVFGGLALLAWAGAMGWYLHEWTGRGNVEVSVDRPVQVYAPEVVSSGTVPNVVGLTEEEARRVLSDAGVALGSVQTHVVPDVGPPGLIVSQTPPSGVEVAHRSVTLEVSGPAVMPDLEGKSEAEAKEALSAFGARVSVVTEYEPGAAEGSVVSTEPAAGETIVDKATLRVAEPLSSVFLTEIEPLQASCRTGEEAVIAGQAQTEAIICLPEPGANPRSVVYQLGGGIETFRANLGLDDAGNAEAQVEFHVLVDGNQVFSHRLSFGESLPVEVPLLGSYQLELEAVAVGPAEPGGPEVRAAFGEPQLVGSRSAVDAIEGLEE
jgi:hypothetical protein